MWAARGQGFFCIFFKRKGLVSGAGVSEAKKTYIYFFRRPDKTG